MSKKSLEEKNKIDRKKYYLKLCLYSALVACPVLLSSEVLANFDLNKIVGRGFNFFLNPAKKYWPYGAALLGALAGFFSGGDGREKIRLGGGLFVGLSTLCYALLENLDDIPEQ